MLERFVAHPVNKKKEKKSNHTEREPFFFCLKEIEQLGPCSYLPMPRLFDHSSFAGRE
jgi:hypothetical protein